MRAHLLPIWPLLFEPKSYLEREHGDLAAAGRVIDAEQPVEGEVDGEDEVEAAGLQPRGRLEELVEALHELRGVEVALARRAPQAERVEGGDRVLQRDQVEPEALLQRAQLHGRAVGAEADLVEVGQRLLLLQHFRVLPRRHLGRVAKRSFKSLSFS